MPKQEQPSLWDEPGGRSDNAAESIQTVDSAVLVDGITEAIRAGWMVSFSSGRDGFAVRLSVFNDGQKSARWFEDAASLERALQGLIRSSKLAQAGDGQVGPGKG